MFASIAPLISQGVSLLQQQARSAYRKIVSWCSIKPSEFRQKISKVFDTRIARLKGTNPRAIVKDFSQRASSGKATKIDEASTGFYEFADVCDTLSGNIGNIISIEATQSIENMRIELMKYPPPPPNSTYNRTFRLQQGWQTAVVSFNADMTFAGDSMTTVANPISPTSLGNNVAYTKWVQRRDVQLPIHRGRWNTIDDLAEQEVPELADRLQSFFDDVMNI